jgi:bifunctional oligoribonuclease and PAP phosphatase NrnA
LNTISFTPIKDIFSLPRKILLTSHTNPDGDAIGACLAMYLYFKNLGHRVHVIVPNPFPEFLAWMNSSEEILIYEKNKKQCDELFETSEIVFSLDYNHPNRLANAEQAFKQSKGIKIMIDHHIQPKRDAYDYVFTTVDISSTSELIFDFIHEMHPEALNRSIAECIYTGIMTDTGSFSYSCNYEKTFRIVAELYKTGMDGVKINRMVYSTFSESRLRLIGFAISDKLKVFPEFATAYISLTKEELNRYNHQVGDTEGLVNYALAIKGIRFAALFVEREKKIRISLRSVGNFGVNSFAKKHFEGGGHKNAAGGDSFISMEETLEKFEALLPDYQKELSQK